MKDTIIFDLDGTLLFTLPDLTHALNFALKKLGREKFSLEKVKNLVGFGFDSLVKASFPDESELEEAAINFTGYYKENCCVDTKPYPGIIELINELKEKGYKIAVCTNKRESIARKILSYYFGDIFDYIIGETPNLPMKPAPDMLLEVVKVLDTDVSKAVFIGDSVVDFLTSVNADMDHIMVGWGFESKKTMEKAGAKCFIDNAEEIYEFI